MPNKFASSLEILRGCPIILVKYSWENSQRKSPNKHDIPINHESFGWYIYIYNYIYIYIYIYTYIYIRYLYIYIHTHYTHLCCSLTVHRSRQDLTLDRLKVVPPSAPWEKMLGRPSVQPRDTEYSYNFIVDVLNIILCDYSLLFLYDRTIWNYIRLLLSHHDDYCYVIISVITVTTISMIIAIFFEAAI